MTPIPEVALKDVPKRVLKESWLREYRRLLTSRPNEALAIFKRDLILKMGNEWWRQNRQQVLAELKKENEG